MSRRAMRRLRQGARGLGAGRRPAPAANARSARELARADTIAAEKAAEYKALQELWERYQGIRKADRPVEEWLLREELVSTCVEI